MFSSVRLQPQCPLPIDVSDRGPPTTWSPHAHRRINGQRHDHVMKHDHLRDVKSLFLRQWTTVQRMDAPMPRDKTYSSDSGEMPQGAQRRGRAHWRRCAAWNWMFEDILIIVCLHRRGEELTRERDPDFRWSQAQRRWHTQQRNVRETINRCSGLQIQTSVLVNVIFSCDVVPQIN